ncbi:MAG: hypothetical protein ACK56F_00095, partial [bacterium]
RGLHHDPPRPRVGMEYASHRRVEPTALLGGHHHQQAAISDDALEQQGGRPQFVPQGCHDLGAERGRCLAHEFTMPKDSGCGHRRLSQRTSGSNVRPPPPV